MSTDHHTPIVSGAEATSLLFNNPLGELDAAINDLDLSTRGGVFTLDVNATTVVTNTNVTTNSTIHIMPTNAAAATLMSGAKSLYVSSRTAGVSFTVVTADNGVPNGTEAFSYIVLN